MTNQEKYKEAKIRVKKFSEYCYHTQCYRTHDCEYKIRNCDEATCFAKWLEMEYQSPKN